MTTSLLPWLTHPLSLTLGRTLLHFLWQGAALGLIAAVCSYFLRRSPAARRYGVLLLLFTVMSALPAATFLALWQSSEIDSGTIVAENSPVTAPERVGVNFSLVENDDGVLAMTPEFRVTKEPPSPDQESSPSPPAEMSLFQFEQSLPWFVAAWLLGVAACSLRLWAGLFGVVRIRWQGRSAAPDVAARLCGELRQRLGITRAVTVCESLLVQVPVVIGWLKPLILFPAGMITGLDEAQIRALLAHELAHLRRHDYLVNIFQAVVETLLFYHPAVWWLSRRLRQERELCCDDIVVQVTGDRLIYARTLSDLASRATNPAWAAAATDGHLLARIRHILGKPAPRSGLLSGHWAAVVVIALAVGGGMAWQVSVVADQSAEDITNESESPANSVNEVDEEPEKPAIVEFSDGRSVEFVGITKNTAPASEGWQPNGLPLGDVGYWKSTTVLHNGNTSSTYTENGEHPEPDANAIDFLFRFRGLKAQPSLQFHLPANGSNYSHWPVQDPYELRVSTRKREAPPPGAQWQPPDGVVHVGFTDEPWGRYVKISPAGEFLDPIQSDELYATTYALITILGTRPHDRAPGQSVIVMREPSDNTDPADNWHQYAFEFRAVDTDGKPHWALAWSSTNSAKAPQWKESQYGLAQPLPEGKKLSHYEFRLRPYRHWATFENVSLEPGEKTQVKAASALVSDADVLARQFAQALRRQGVPYLDNAQIQYLSRSLHDGIAPRLKSPLRVNRRQQLAAAVSAYVQREFDPAEKDALYLEFQNRFQTLKWALGLALEQPELTADEITRLDRQRQWMRAEIEKLPESAKFRLWHEDELAKLESLLDDPLNPFFARPMSDDEFALFQAAYQQKLEGNRSETRLVFAASWLFQAAWTVQLDGLLKKYPVDNIGSGVHNLRWSLTVTRHPGNVALDVGDRRKQVRDIYLDVMKMIFVPGDAPANQDDCAEWLREQGQGDLAFDGTDSALVGVRGAKLAVVEATDWPSADQIPLATLEHLLETSGQDFVSLSTFVEPDGDPANGIQKLRAAAPSLAIRTNEGKIAVIRLLSMSGDTPVVRSRARPLLPNLPLHPGDMVAMKSADEEGDLRSEETRVKAASATLAGQHGMETAAWGKVRNGLRCRLIAVSPGAVDESPEIAERANQFGSDEEVTFVVELQNVSQKPVSLISVDRLAELPHRTLMRQRFAESRDSDVLVDANTLGPALFQFEFTDAAGKPVSHPLAELSQPFSPFGLAVVQKVEPGKSLLVVLRPAHFDSPHEYRLPAGQYRAKVRYLGPNEKTLQAIRTLGRRNQSDLDNLWADQVDSHEIPFIIAPDPAQPQPTPLVWGDTYEGLQAAMELRAEPNALGTDDPAGTFPAKGRVRAVLHVKNVSNRVIRFASEVVKDEMGITAINEAGQERLLRIPHRDSNARLVRWTLEPGQIAQISAVSGINQLDEPGKYRLRYRASFRQPQVFADRPRLDVDWQQELLTGEIAVVIRPRRPEDAPQQLLALPIVQKIGPAVVAINTKQTDQVGDTKVGRGMGIVVDERGLVITAQHLVADVDEIRVVSNDPRFHLGRVVATEEAHNLALLQVARKFPQAAKFGTSANVKVRDVVYALSGLSDLSRGAVNALGRTVKLNESRSFHNLIQTDLRLQPGSSGGPLVNAEGDIIGVNVALPAGKRNLGFSWPIDDLKPVIAKMLQEASEKAPVEEEEQDLRSEARRGQETRAEHRDDRAEQEQAERPVGSVDGEVVDKATGQAVAGATVRFRFLKIRREPGESDDVPPELVFRDVGQFTFTLPDGITDPKYYLLERSAEHPDYQTLGPTMISLSEALNGEPKQASDFLRRIELVPGEVVTGQVIDLDGKPARGVPVFSGDNRQGYQNGGLHETVTDANGRFRLVVPRRNPKHRGRIYLVPTHAAAVSRAITENYGEQEVYQLRRGTRVKGRVVDAERNGVPGVVVRANAGERIPYRSATTAADGRYELPPCAYGDYVVELLDEGTLPHRKQPGAKLPDAYLGQKLSLPKDAPAEHVLDFEPVDSVRVTARGVNNDDTPAADLNLTVGGARKGGPYWRGKLRPIADEPGRYEVRVPRELQQLRIEQEMGPGTFLRIPNNWSAKLDENFEGFEVRQLKAARVTFRATLDGQPFDLRAFKYNVPWPGSISPWPRFADAEAARRLGAVQSNSMDLEKLADGTLRISVHPEIDLVVNLEGPGFKPQLVNFWLKEGEERTIDVHLESLTPAKRQAEGDLRSEERRGQETRAEQPSARAEQADTEQPETEQPGTAKSRKPWQAFGRVTDANGKPLVGVKVSADCGLGTLHTTGVATTDDEGKYELNFGPGILFGKESGPHLQAATIHAHQPGYFEVNLNRQGGRSAADGPVAEKELQNWKTRAEEVFQPGRPLEINFVMQPAGRVAGKLIDEMGQPLAGYSVSLAGPDLPPSSSVLAQTKADEQGRFTLEDIPTTFRFQLVVRKSNPKPPWDDSWASAALRFERPEAGDLRAWFGEREIRLDEFVLRVTGPGVHGKTAMPRAGNAGVLHLTATDPQQVLEQSEKQLVARSAVLTLSNEPGPDAPPSLITEAVPSAPAQKSKTSLARTRPNDDGEFQITFENPAGFDLQQGKHQVIFQVFVGVSQKPIREKIFRQLDISPDGKYSVAVKIDPAWIDDSRVSLTFVTIQADHDAWVKAFFQEGKGTKYSGIWTSDGGLLPTIPWAVADAP